MSGLVLTQPMYLPWRGLFDQMRLSNVFVYYDDVQLPKGGGKKGRGFITRVQVKRLDGESMWLSLPISRSNSGFQLIKDAKFADQAWRRKHLATFKNHYVGTPFFDEVYFDLLTGIYDFRTDFLSQFCINGMSRIAGYLGIHRELQLSSDIGIPGDRSASQRVLDHCLYFGVKRYITGHGALNYLDHALFERAGVEVWYMEYSLSPYPQVAGDFNPYVSIIDLLFNVGQEAPRYLDSGLRFYKDVMAPSV